MRLAQISVAAVSFGGLLQYCLARASQIHIIDRIRLDNWKLSEIVCPNTVCPNTAYPLKNTVASYSDTNTNTHTPRERQSEPVLALCRVAKKWKTDTINWNDSRPNTVKACILERAIAVAWSFIDIFILLHCYTILLCKVANGATAKHQANGQTKFSVEIGRLSGDSERKRRGAGNFWAPKNRHTTTKPIMSSSSVIDFQISNVANLEKIERCMNANAYRENIQYSSNFNTRLCHERQLRLPFFDPQTNVAQNHCSLYMTKRQRMPGINKGQIYSYPGKVQAYASRSSALPVSFECPY